MFSSALAQVDDPAMKISPELTANAADISLVRT